eukprot:m.48156 g.48156  ORF g.48156 m.48156 type:complete len:51 (+) comp13272_c0_seq1:538-690(+)
MSSRLCIQSFEACDHQKIARLPVGISTDVLPGQLLRGPGRDTHRKPALAH